MKLACTSYSLNRSLTAGKRNLDEFIVLCSEQGAEGVEIWADHVGSPEGLMKIERALDLTGIRLAAVALEPLDLNHPDLDLRTAAISETLAWIRATAAAGGSVLRLVPGSLKRLNAARDVLYPLAKDSIVRCAASAADCGVRLALENCPAGVNARVVLDMVRDINLPNVGTCPDPGNFLPAERDEMVQEFVPYALHFHFKTYGFDKEGNEASIDYVPIMRLLASSGFDGWVSAEFEGDTPEEDGVTRSLSLAKRLLFKLGGSGRVST